MAHVTAEVDVTRKSPFLWPSQAHSCVCVLKDLPLARLTFKFSYFHVLISSAATEKAQDEVTPERAGLGAALGGNLQIQVFSLCISMSILSGSSSSSVAEDVNSHHFWGGGCIFLLKANNFQSCLETFIIIVIPGTTPLGRGVLWNGFSSLGTRAPHLGLPAKKRFFQLPEISKEIYQALCLKN